MSVTGRRRTPLLTCGAAVVCGALLMLGTTACSSPGTDTVGAVTGSAPPAAPVTDVPSLDPTPSPVPDKPTAGAAASGPTRVLPNLVGKGLQAAQNRAQAAGFPALRSHDALGRKRVQIFDRDWKVCSQSPAPGRRAVSTRVDFAVVKLDERCPKKDQGAASIPKAAGTMPNLTGKSAAVAVEALGTDASITWRDGTGQERTVLLPTNWRVCAQLPKPGAGYGGVPVTLTVVKYGESC